MFSPSLPSWEPWSKFPEQSWLWDPHSWNFPLSAATPDQGLQLSCLPPSHLPILGGVPRPRQSWRGWRFLTWTCSHSFSLRWCWLWWDMFWEPLNVSHNASCCTVPGKCISTSKGKGSFCGNSWSSVVQQAVVWSLPSPPAWRTPEQQSGPWSWKSQCSPTARACVLSAASQTVTIIEVFCCLSSNKCLLACSWTHS